MIAHSFRADLHCHSSCSDGTATSDEIILSACSIGLQGLSITDHDTIAAYEKAIAFAHSHHLPLITGVEFSTVHRKTSVHVLGYSFSPDAPSILNLCRRHSERRKVRARAILQRLSTRGVPLSWEELIEDQPAHILPESIGRPHIALAMIKRGYVDSIKQAFQNYIGDNCPCYVPGESFSVEETLEAIHQAKGFAIIAHPHLVKSAKVLKDLLGMKFDGIEAYYARMPSSQSQKWLKIAHQKGWIATGGSDFHGTIKSNLPLGSSWVNQEIFTILYQRFRSNHVLL